MSIYCVADLHGKYNLWLKIKQYLKEDDELYILGDVIDRGSGGIKILRDIVNSNNKNIHFLLGNHEQFFLEWYNNPNDIELLNIWNSNGGKVTRQKFKHSIGVEDKLKIIKLLRNAPVFKKISINNKNYYLSHSGFKQNNLYSNNEYNYTEEREHFNEPWLLGENDYMIFGHTPLQLLMTDKKPYDVNNGAMIFCNGHKINIDGGAVWSGISILFKLDTMESILIK